MSAIDLLLEFLLEINGGCTFLPFVLLTLNSTPFTIHTVNSNVVFVHWKSQFSLDYNYSLHYTTLRVPIQVISLFKCILYHFWGISAYHLARIKVIENFLKPTKVVSINLLSLFYFKSWYIYYYQIHILLLNFISC